MPVRRILSLLAVCAAVFGLYHLAEEATAEAQASRTFFAQFGDGGVATGPIPVPARGGAPLEVRCRSNDLRSILAQNSRNSVPYIRVGPCPPEQDAGVSATNGIEVGPGESVTWPVGQGRMCAISEMFHDAGIPLLNAVCAAGGPRVP